MQCRVVPRERCALVTSEGLQPRARCRVNTRLVCEDKPRQKCGNKVGQSHPFLSLAMSASPKLDFGFTIIMQYQFI